jgi:hypothetical protein
MSRTQHKDPFEHVLLQFLPFPLFDLNFKASCRFRECHLKAGGPGDVPWIISGEKFDEEEGVFVKIAIELEVEPESRSFLNFISLTV